MTSNPKAGAVALLALALAGSAAYGAVELRQPHMENALAALQKARGELNAAERNKGGHRSRAAHLVDQAIAEVQAGIEAREEAAEHAPH
jgi:hypothetical protein